jgi:hypothetical protein
MATVNEKIEKVEYINNKNIDLVHKRFTGSYMVHWKDGEPMVEEENRKKDIKLD